MKKKVESLLCQALRAYSTETQFAVLDTPVHVERPRDLSHGDFSSNIAMILAKYLKVAPRQCAEQLLKHLPEDDDIETISLAGPGFINFKLSPKALESTLRTMWFSNTCGVEPIERPETVVIDYSSPNLAKEMHVGHLRSTIIGDALVRTFELKGYTVIRQNHVGDWGTQFGMLIAHLADEETAHPGSVELNDLETFYKAAKLRFDTEPDFAERARLEVVRLQSADPHCLALWKRFIQLSLAHCQDIYRRLGVLLQVSDVKAESAYNDTLPEIINSLRAQELLVEHDGAQCVFLPEFKGKNNEPLPIIVQKKDGGFLYATTDLAAIQYRQTVLEATRILYVVDARQSLHFQQIFTLAHRAGYAKETTSLEHVSFGMVLDKSGKPFKSRDGGVTKLSDLLDEAERRAQALIETKQATLSSQESKEMARVLAISSVKYADLSKNRTSDYIFDWDTMLSFEGNTAPYLLYAYTRIHTLLQKTNLESPFEQPFIFANDLDKQLAKQIILFPEVVEIVITKTAPHFLCAYLFELSGLFSTFYEACPILNESEPIKQSRLVLITLTARVLALGLSLLGIETLKRM